MESGDDYCSPGLAEAGEASPLEEEKMSHRIDERDSRLRKENIFARGERIKGEKQVGCSRGSTCHARVL